MSTFQIARFCVKLFTLLISVAFLAGCPAMDTHWQPPPFFYAAGVEVFDVALPAPPPPEPAPPEPAPPPPPPPVCRLCSTEVWEHDTPGIFCDDAEARRQEAFRSCACEGACAVACADAWLCGGEPSNYTGPCEKCTKALIFCGRELYSCENSTDAPPCLLGQKYDATGQCVDFEPQCADAWCTKSCTEPGRYTKEESYEYPAGIVVDKAHGRKLWLKFFAGGYAGDQATAAAKCAAVSTGSIPEGWRLPTRQDFMDIALKPCAVLGEIATAETVKECKPTTYPQPEGGQYCYHAHDQAAFGVYTGHKFWIGDPAYSKYLWQPVLGSIEPLITSIGGTVRCVHDPVD